MFCTNCGAKLEEDSKFCTNCGAKLESKTENIQKVENPTITEEEANKKANKFCIISLVLNIVIPIIQTIIMLLGFYKENNYIISLLVGLLYLAEPVGLALMIYVRVKYPNNKFGKILMWIYIIEFIIGVILAIVFVVTCVNGCINDIRNC